MSVCVDAAGYRSSHSKLVQRGRCYPRLTSCMATTHTTWACIRASSWRRASGCTMVLIRVVHSCSSTTISEGVCEEIRASVVLQSTISEGGAWGHTSYGLYYETHQGFPRRALLAAPKGDLQTSELRPVELPRLARPKGCFAAYYARSKDELSGRTTGRLGNDRPHSAYAIGGTAELALQNSNLSPHPTTRPRHLSVTTGRQGLLEQGQRRSIRQSRRTVHGTTGRRKQQVAAAELSVPQDLSKHYGPTRSSGRRHRLRRGRSTFRGTTGRTDPPDGYAGIHRGKRTI